jgi:hypothetical protein
LQVGELDNFRGQSTQLIKAEVERLQVGELDNFRGQSTQLIKLRSSDCKLVSWTISGGRALS